ncbi:MAG: DUF4238 domain-containing protein [Actinomycetota bacterium]|nr:DUF4238 domain-containing protein [Actinomycetota bacterium]
MAKKGQKRARAHHVLPQFYLRAWANETHAVTMLMREGREVTTGTEALAVEKDFYTLTAPDGRKDSSVEEALLRNWDARGAEVHRRLLGDDFPLDDDARLNFGLFLGLQWLRGRAARRVGEEFHDTVQKLLIKLGLDLAPLMDSDAPKRAQRPAGPPFPDGPGIEVPHLGHLPDEVKEVLAEQDSYTFELPQEHSILKMVQGVPDAAATFIHARWVLVRAEGIGFWTSDEPIALYRKPTPENQHLGLGPVNAELIQFPLSPSRCLIIDRMSPDAPDLVGDATARMVDDANKLTLHGRWQQLFRHPESPPFPPAPPLPERFVELA